MTLMFAFIESSVKVFLEAVVWRPFCAEPFRTVLVFPLPVSGLASILDFFCFRKVVEIFLLDMDLMAGLESSTNIRLDVIFTVFFQIPKSVSTKN
jgi:hypothetical protein